MNLPPKGEARRNPFYAAQRLAEQLGANTAWQHGLGSRRGRCRDCRLGAALESHSGAAPGDRAMGGQWRPPGRRQSVPRHRGVRPVEWHFPRSAGRRRRERQKTTRKRRKSSNCRRGATTWKDDGAQYRMCGSWGVIPLKSTQPAIWSLHDDIGMQVVRVQHGRGTHHGGQRVALRHESAGQGERSRAAVRGGDATAARRQRVLRLRKRKAVADCAHLAVRRAGRPAGRRLAGADALARRRQLWPLASREREAARRSLAEQIRGTAHFALRIGGGESLHAATLRAFTSAAQSAFPVSPPSIPTQGRRHRTL